MYTERINKVLALAMEANPDLPIPLSVDNMDLDDITSTPNAKRNTQATLYARDTGDVVRYAGNSAIYYDRIDIARYWQQANLIENPQARTVKDLVAILRNRYGLDVLDTEVVNVDDVLPDAGTVTVIIDDTASPLYIGQVEVAFAKDAGLSEQDGVAYELGVVADGIVLAYSDGALTLQCSINDGYWTTMTRSRNPKTGQYEYRSATTDSLSNAYVRIRGGAVSLMDDLGTYVPLTYLTLYRGSTDATAYCAGIRSLLGVRPGVFYHRPDLVSADYLFDGCTRLTDLPEHLFSPCLNLRSAKAVFRNTAITSVPESVFESCGALTNLTSAFEQCTKLTTVPEGLFRTNAALTTLRRGFLGCYAIQNTFATAKFMAPLVKLADAAYLFADCPAVAVIPAGFLKNQTELLTVEGMFSQCYGIRVIPSDLFSTTTKLNNVSRLFEGCAQLPGIPPGIFQYLPNLEYAESTFANTAIQTTPEVMFTYTRRLISIDRIFANCTRLTVIPTTLLKPLLRLQSANGVWQGCRGITTIPESLLAFNTNLVSATWLFANTQVTTIPAILFAQTVKLTDLTGAFAQTALTTVSSPETFKTLTKLTTVARLFYKCSSLTTLTAPLFANNVALRNLRGMTAYSGLSINIAALFTNMPDVTKITDIAGLYQGCGNMLGGFDVDLKAALATSAVNWTDANTTQGCVAGCTRLADYPNVGTIYKTPLPELV